MIIQYRIRKVLFILITYISKFIYILNITILLTAEIKTLYKILKYYFSSDFIFSFLIIYILTITLPDISKLLSSFFKI